MLQLLLIIVHFLKCCTNKVTKTRCVLDNFTLI